MTDPRVTARDLNRLLVAGGVEALCRELLGHGHREGSEWVAPSIVGASRRSFSVHLTGSKAGVWGEFDQALVRGVSTGDLFDLAARILFAGDKKATFRWALIRTGMSNGQAPTRVALPPRPAGAGPDAHERATAALALRVFLEARETIRGTMADDYLQGRGLFLSELGRATRSLRFHPACRCTEAGRDMPALVAAICGPDGRHMATHRTYLAELDGKVVKAPLRSPKKVLGSYRGGTIRLWRGGSGKPLAEAPETDTIVISEGLENGLSCALACPEYRVLAAVSLSNLAAIELPPQAVDLIIAADNDQGNPAAEAALQRAVDRLLAQGRSVRIAHSSIGKDFNDGIKSE